MHMQCMFQQEPQIFQMHFSTDTQGEFIPKHPFQLKGAKDEEINFSFLVPMNYERAYRMLNFVITEDWIKSSTINCGQENN